MINALLSFTKFLLFFIPCTLSSGSLPHKCQGRTRLGENRITFYCRSTCIWRATVLCNSEQDNTGSRYHGLDSGASTVSVRHRLQGWKLIGNERHNKLRNFPACMVNFSYAPVASCVIGPVLASDAIILSVGGNIPFILCLRTSNQGNKLKITSLEPLDYDVSKFGTLLAQKQKIRRMI